MEIGIVVPQGWTGEYAGWPPERAWSRTIAVARHAEALGFGSIWLFDHFQTTPEPADELTFEAFTSLAALAGVTSRVRIGHLVLCSSYRNPALVAKMAGTLDVISGGRFELGLGAGWKQDEWLAYGYGFPPLGERLERLRDSLEIAQRMLRPGRATYAGRHASVSDAINLPRGLQAPRIPILVGGNGPRVTWRLAAQFADELNLDWVAPAGVREAIPVIAAHCRAAERDPAGLRLSVHLNWHEVGRAGSARQDLLAAYRDLGVARVMAFLRAAVDDDEALPSLAADARAIGLLPAT